MSEEAENANKPNDAQIRKDLLEKSAELKEKREELKQQMDSTAKAYQDFLKDKVGGDHSQ
jgi:DNA-binding transcriptional MerR regulator